MSMLATIAKGTANIAAGTGALSLVGATRALLTDPGAKGIGGFVFSIPMSDEVTLSAQITDHWLEDNMTAQDHVALEPIRLRLTGVVGELVYEKDKLELYLNQVLDRLGPLGVVQPSVASSTRQWLSQYNQTSQAVNQAVKEYANAEAAFRGTDVPKNKQQEAYSALEGMFISRSRVPRPTSLTGLQTAASAFSLGALYKPQIAASSEMEFLTVVTPWKTYKDMAIESVIFTQDESTRDMSTVEVTLKQVRTIAIARASLKLPGRAAGPGGVLEQGKKQSFEQSIAVGTATGGRQ